MLFCRVTGNWRPIIKAAICNDHLIIYLRKEGLEPSRLSAPPPQDGASASSATSAYALLAGIGLLRLIENIAGSSGGGRSLLRRLSGHGRWRRRCLGRPASEVLNNS